MSINGPRHLSLSLRTATTTVSTAAGTYGGTGSLASGTAASWDRGEEHTRVKLRGLAREAQAGDDRGSGKQLRRDPKHVGECSQEQRERVEGHDDAHVCEGRHPDLGVQPACTAVSAFVCVRSPSVSTHL